jgi:hypothetical protein
MFSLVLMLEIEPITNKELKILYEGVYEGDEVMILVWSIVHGVDLIVSGCVDQYSKSLSIIQ